MLVAFCEALLDRDGTALGDPLATEIRVDFEMLCRIFRPTTVSGAFSDGNRLDFPLEIAETDLIVGNIRLEEVVIVGRRLDDVCEFFEAGR